MFGNDFPKSPRVLRGRENRLGGDILHGGPVTLITSNVFSRFDELT